MEKMESSNVLNKILAKELHAPSRRKFPTRRVITLDIDDLWQADLVEMTEKRNPRLHFSNRHYKYILTVIDTFSKFAFAVPLKKKTANEVTEAFKKIFSGHNRYPRNLHTDEGKEFFNSTFQDLMKQHKINHYNTYSKKKASIVERFNRTLKEKMWKYFTRQQTKNWIDNLQNFIDEYNNAHHRTIGMAPDTVNQKNKHIVKTRLTTSKTPIKKRKFTIGDIVRCSNEKKLFEKGYIGNWTEELFKIIQVKNTVPTVYKIVDMNNIELKPTFYEYELKKTQIPHLRRVEKILQRKNDQIKVKWSGYDGNFNSWIPDKTIDNRSVKTHSWVSI